MSSEEKTVIKYEDGSTNFISIIKRFAKNIATVSTIYLFGYFDLSIAWLIAPVLLSAFREEWKKTSDRKRQSVKLAVQDEKNVILAQLGDLPAWVSEIGAEASPNRNLRLNVYSFLFRYIFRTSKEPNG